MFFLTIPSIAKKCLTTLFENVQWGKRQESIILKVPKFIAQSKTIIVPTFNVDDDGYGIIETCKNTGAELISEC